MSNHGITAQGYADDIVIIARGKFEETVCDIVQNGLNITNMWCQSVGLSINPTKTVAVPFTKRRKLNLKELVLDGQVIAYEKSIKYLGVVMDKELRWGLHQATVIEKAKRAIMVCSRMAKGSWGCKPKIMLWMYNMMVKPIITYGSVVWSERTKLCCGKKTWRRYKG